MRTLLLCDVGNTSLKVGVADENEVRASFPCPSPAGETPDSLGRRLLDVLRLARVRPEELEAAAISSVVPQADFLLRQAVGSYLGCPCLFASEDMAVPLENRYERPWELGADRLVCAYAARRLFPATPSFVIVDYGTAATFDCVEGDAFLGGLIFPGPQTAARALAANAARLPEIAPDFAAARIAPCRDTRSGIARGLALGFGRVTECFARHLGQGLRKPVLTLASGGFARDMARLAPVFDRVIPNLTLAGLRILYFECAGQ